MEKEAPLTDLNSWEQAWAQFLGSVGALVRTLFHWWPSVLRPPQLGESQGRAGAAILHSVLEPQGPQSSQLLRLREDRDLPRVTREGSVFAPGPPRSTGRREGSPARPPHLSLPPRLGARCSWGMPFGAGIVFSFLKGKPRLLLPVTLDNFV